MAPTLGETEIRTRLIEIEGAYGEISGCDQFIQKFHGEVAKEGPEEAAFLLRLLESRIITRTLIDELGIDLQVFMVRPHRKAGNAGGGMRRNINGENKSGICIHVDGIEGVLYQESMSMCKDWIRVFDGNNRQALRESLVRAIEVAFPEAGEITLSLETLKSRIEIFTLALGQFLEEGGYYEEEGNMQGYVGIEQHGLDPSDLANLTIVDAGDWERRTHDLGERIPKKKYREAWRNHRANTQE